MERLTDIKPRLYSSNEIILFDLLQKNVYLLALQLH